MDLQVKSNQPSFQALKIGNLKEWTKEDPATLNAFLDNEHVQEFSKKFDVKADYFVKKEKKFGEEVYHAGINMAVKPLNAGFFTSAAKMNLKSFMLLNDTADEAKTSLRFTLKNLDSVSLINKYLRTDAGKEASRKESLEEFKNRLEEFNKE